RRRGDFELSEEAKVELIEKQSKMQARKRRGSVSIGEAAPDEEIANALRESATCHVHGLNVEGLSVRVASGPSCTARASCRAARRRLSCARKAARDIEILRPTRTTSPLPTSRMVIRWPW
ncbi:unnamed protein product, partial [Prorocentrum cordatum]